MSLVCGSCTEREKASVETATEILVVARGSVPRQKPKALSYCKDSNRRSEHEHTSFSFLGFAFRPRGARRKDGVCFTWFSPAISPEALKAKGADLRNLRIHQAHGPVVRRLGTMAEPHRGRVDELLRPVLPVGDLSLLRRVSIYLRRWAGRKYRRLRTLTRFKRWWARVIDRAPDLFAHWRWVRTC